ncbi:Homocysteine S-methyltransferase 1 [Podochytrium sp. JEL0797]|nr:Homocysteine S-methyltransferase 1 [Podochytrium sp. JEL0797]
MTVVVDSPKVKLLDGGLGTHLEELGAVFGNDPLWSTGLLLTAEGRALIEKAHLNYIEAGCEILMTGTYQAFVPTSTVKTTVSPEIDLPSLFPVAMSVARSAIAKSGRTNVEVAASMGSYGAVLANGAEFTGDFGEISWDALVEFHQVRLETVLKTGPDLLAFETVPSVFESSAIVRALELCSTTHASLPPAWLSFSCASSNTSCAGDSIESCATSIKQSPYIFAAGVNCTAPEYVLDIVQCFRRVLEGTGKGIVAYPNKGESWDGVEKVWVNATGVHGVEKYAEMAKSWIDAGATIVGGLLDGGLGTHLEELGAHFDNDPLWSTGRLLTKEGRALIEKAHMDYIEAGCDILTTGTYQAFVPTSAVKSTVSADIDLESLFPVAVKVARNAVNKSRKLHVQIAASMGSYGAVLANGGEFTGDFGDIQWNDLVLFHQTRLETVLNTGPDLLAFETVPSVFESTAIVRALELCAGTSTLPPAWIAFSCSSGTQSCAGDSIDSCATSVRNSPHLFAAGVNCSKPEFVEEIVKSFKIVFEDTGKEIIAYPNKGESWDNAEKAWVESTGVDGVEKYADMAKRWMDAGATIVGGVCICFWFIPQLPNASRYFSAVESVQIT